MLLADDERIGICEVAGVPAAPVARVMKMKCIARHVLGRGNDVLAVGSQRHEFAGGDQALAHQGAGIAGLPLRVGGNDAVLGDGAGAVLGPGLEGSGAMALESSSAPSASVRGKPRIWTSSARCRRVLRCSLPQVEIERRDRLGEAPEVDAFAGGHGVAVHDRFEVAKPRHLVDNDQQVALKRFDAGDGVWDGYPQAKPALDVLDGVFRRDHEKVGIAIGQIQGIEAWSCFGLVES